MRSEAKVFHGNGAKPSCPPFAIRRLPACLAGEAGSLPTRVRYAPAVARLIQRSIERPRPCAYLPVRQASLETRLMIDVSPAELQRYLERGWRRFGPAYFRPACPACSECVSVRVPVDAFAPSANMRRVWKRAAHLRVEVGKPQLKIGRAHV